MILFINLYQFVYSNNHDIPSKLISKNSNDHHLSILTNDKDNQIQNGSFNIIVRMIAFGIHRTDDDERQKLVDTDLSVINNKKLQLLSNRDFDRSEDEQNEELQKNTRLLLLPLMIRMLLERMAERVNTTQQSMINDASNPIKLLKNKQNIFYESIKRFIIITVDVTKVEKATIIIFLILSLIVFLLTTFSYVFFHSIFSKKSIHLSCST